MRVLLRFASLAVAFVAAASPAFASDAADPSKTPGPPSADADTHTRTAARALASEGTEAFERREYERALDLFDRALSLVKAPTLALMRARTLVELGRWVEAVDTYATLPRGDDDPNNPTFRQATDDAAQELGALLPRLPRLRVTVRGLDSSRAEVRVDGRKLTSALVGVDNPLDPGTHRIEVLTPGRPPEVRDVTLLEREKQEIVIELAAPEPPAKKEPPPPPPPRPIEEASAGPSTAAIATLSVGGAGVLFGSITGAIALGKKSELDAACGAGCPPSMRDTLSAYRLERALSYVGFGVGVVGVGVGSYLWLKEPEDEAGPSVSLGIVPGGVSVSGKF